MVEQKRIPVWPEWEIEQQLGRGSYGVVYKAVRRDSNVVSHSAIKVISVPFDKAEIDSLRAEGLDDVATKSFFKNIVDDFVSEIQLMESLKGTQNIVTVEDYKVVEKTNDIGWEIYIRMELLTPFNFYARDRVFTEKEVIKIGIDMCSALEICSKRNVIHRDIKPENMFVNDFGYFKLGDFGIARKLENATGGLSQKGTYNYMAPEVASSDKYDTRADIYSLGIVLYRLLNQNRLPFIQNEQQLLSPVERKNAVDRRLRGEPIPAPCNASPNMVNLILRACAFNPDLRFKTATEMKYALMAVENGNYIPVRFAANGNGAPNMTNQPRQQVGAYPNNTNTAAYQPRPQGDAYPNNTNTPQYQPRPQAGAYPNNTNTPQYQPRPQGGAYPNNTNAPQYQPRPQGGAYPNNTNAPQYQPRPQGGAYPNNTNAPQYQPRPQNGPYQQNGTYPPNMGYPQQKKKKAGPWTWVFYGVCMFIILLALLDEIFGTSI